MGFLIISLIISIMVGKVLVKGSHFTPSLTTFYPRCQSMEMASVHSAGQFKMTITYYESIKTRYYNFQRCNYVSFLCYV